MSEIKAVLFDLGGVLVDFTGLEEVRPLMRDDPGADAVKAKWGTSQAIQDFEHGRIDGPAFAAAFVEEWGVDLAADAFLPVFESWVTGPRPGAYDLLGALRLQVKTACLSNTNAVHWRKMAVEGELLRHLDYGYASHLLGRMKPSRQVFAHVCIDMDVAPAEVLFFDDGMGNVEGARAAGLQAEQATSIAELRQALGARGLL